MPTDERKSASLAAETQMQKAPASIYSSRQQASLPLLSLFLLSSPHPRLYASSSIYRWICYSTLLLPIYFTGCIFAKWNGKVFYSLVSHPVHPPCRLGHPKQDMKCCWSLQPEVIPLCVIISSVCGPITWVLGEECTSSKGGTWQGQRAEIRRCWYAIFTALNSGPPSLCFNQRWFGRAFSFSVQPSVRDVAAVWLFSVRQVCYKPVWNIITETLQV